MPPFDGVAIKVTDVPAQIFKLLEVIETFATALVLTITKTVSLEMQFPFIAVKI